MRVVEGLCVSMPILVTR
ncbi:Protein of unknown function [Anaplasma phagocytophilum]|uniref:Uncharacterized protein n=1 Tax=Anaplasma phagocytophilum TaxID=948 RepID=A0A098GKV5_ANAPH|nr:Protein of unknown function [Anaplasma phagocytophilum]